MNKDLLAVTLFPVDIKGSVSDPFESEREIEILTTPLISSQTK